MADTSAAENMMVEKFRAKFRSIRDAFQTLDIRGALHPASLPPPLPRNKACSVAAPGISPCHVLTLRGLHLG